MKTHMINRLFKLALISVASPIMGAQTQTITQIEAITHIQAIAAPPAAAEAPQPLFVIVRPPVQEFGSLVFNYREDRGLSPGVNLREAQRRAVREAQSRARAAGAIDGTFVVTKISINDDHKPNEIRVSVSYKYKVPG
jgi:hypothetical protein